MWDNRSNDVFGLCANHPFISCQLDNFLSIRKLKKALDKGLIHPATESLVVAITLVESWNLSKEKALSWLEPYGFNTSIILEDLKTSSGITMLHPRGIPLIIEPVECDDCDDSIENDGAVVEDCDGVVDSAFDDPTLGDFISDIIFEGGVDCYMEFDGDKYHKSNLVNNMLNSSTKLLSSDRNVRSMTKQSISTKNNDEADDSEQVVISDTIATIAKVKKTKELVVVFVVIDKIYQRTQFVQNVLLEEFQECKFYGKMLLFSELLDGNLIWSGKYGANLVCEGIEVCNSGAESG